MPMVRAYVTPHFDQTAWPSDLNLMPLQLLEFACGQIIPAGLNSKQGPLTPNSIEFIPTIVGDGLTVGVVIDIEAYDYKDRAKNIEARASYMKLGFNTIFPGVTFAVFLKLVKAGWSSDSKDPEFDGEMSLEAAIARYKRRTGHGALVRGNGGML